MCVHVCPIGEVKDESDCRDLYGLESSEELDGDVGVESVAVV